MNADHSVRLTGPEAEALGAQLREIENGLSLLLNEVTAERRGVGDFSYIDAVDSIAEINSARRQIAEILDTAASRTDAKPGSGA